MLYYLYDKLLYSLIIFNSDFLQLKKEVIIAFIFTLIAKTTENQNRRLMVRDWLEPL